MKISLDFAEKYIKTWSTLNELLKIDIINAIEAAVENAIEDNVDKDSYNIGYEDGLSAAKINCKINVTEFQDKSPKLLTLEIESYNQAIKDVLKTCNAHDAFYKIKYEISRLKK